MNIKTLSLLAVQILVSYFVYSTGKHFYASRVKNGKTNPKVFDIGHKYIPDYSNNAKIETLLNILTLLPTAFFMLKGDQQFFTYSITIQIIRLLFIFVTILPKHKTCDDEKYTLSNIFNGHCYDKIFSGHFATVVLSCLILYYTYNVPLSYLIVYMVVVAGLILATRSHYTIDMVVATVVAHWVYIQKLRLT